MKVLTLRQNLIKNVDPLMELRTLVELDLYDNEISEVPDLSPLQNLGYQAFS